MTSNVEAICTRRVLGPECGCLAPSPLPSSSEESHGEVGESGPSPIFKSRTSQKECSSEHKGGRSLGRALVEVGVRREFADKFTDAQPVRVGACTGFTPFLRIFLLPVRLALVVPLVVPFRTRRYQLTQCYQSILSPRYLRPARWPTGLSLDDQYDTPPPSNALEPGPEVANYKSVYNSARLERTLRCSYGFSAAACTCSLPRGIEVSSSSYLVNSRSRAARSGPRIDC